MQKVVNIADEFPEEVRDVFIELFTTIEGGNYRETTGSILRGILNIYKLQLINFGTERLEIENLGLAKALILELRSMILHTFGLFVLLLVLLNLFGYSFGSNRLEILLVVGPAAWEIIRSGRFWLILWMGIQRLWEWLKKSMRRIGK
jgi:hypothetical protein